jgi:putative component of membrane protein insertase Oxa1/YidC/SpoIIIJ protein YidD
VANSSIVGLFEYESCVTVDDYPEQSFTWVLEIEPDDSDPPLVYESCKKEKKVSMYKFCIEGDCDIGAEGEHRLKLDGSWLYSGYRDYREGQCHNLNPNALSVKSKTVQPGVPLRVATDEHDNWPNSNDYWSAEIPSDKWYDPTCSSYEVKIAKEHTGRKEVSSCLWFRLTKAVSGFGIGGCDEWVEPPQSFIWMMKVDPIEEEQPACMSGETGVTLVDSKSVQSSEKANLRANPNPEDQIVKVKDLKAGDLIRGLDESKAPATCTVEAVGSFGTGEVYGNYTQGHYILNSNSGDVAAHGMEQAMSIQEKYDVLTSCPLGVDETGTAFTALDTDFCGGFSKEMSWSDYLLLHKAILRMVRGTGGYWFSGSSYRDFGFLKTHAPIVCATMLRCVKDHGDCLEFEDASIHFIENALSDETKEKAYNSFKNIGRHRELGSVAAMVSDGGSVRK